LAGFVDHYWVTCWDRRGLPPRAAVVLLEPAVHLLLPDAGAHDAQLVGVRRKPFRRAVAGVGWLAGAKFRPGGFYPFVRRDVAWWTDRVASATILGADPEAFAACAAAVRAAGGSGAAPAARSLAPRLDALLSALRAPRGREGDAEDEVAARMVTLMDRVARDRTLRRVADLVRASGWSERTLQRRFARHVGVSPAWVLRRYRVQAAAATLHATPAADPREVAWRLGYADQAHFIRDFRAVAGTTPGAYVRRTRGHRWG
jgi:AraC-like DNA-binding protein